MPILFLFMLPLALIVAWIVFMIRGPREGLWPAFIFFLTAVAAGLWSISQSRASTAAIGIIFLPFFGAICGIFGWLWARFRLRPVLWQRVAAWTCFGLGVSVLALFARGGSKEREKNAQRDLIQAENTRKIDQNREKIRGILAQNRGHETAAVEAAIRESGDDRTFLIPALETEFVSEETLDRLSRSPDMGVVLSVARNKRASPRTLEKIYRGSSYPDYYVQALAANQNTAPDMLRELFERPGAMPGVGQWLAENPSTPRGVLEKLTGSKDAWTLRSLLANKKLDCGLLQAVKRTMSGPGIEDRYSTSDYVRSRLSDLEVQICHAA